jgi:predicted kinase
MRNMRSQVTLMFICGKMAAGKSTLARSLAQRHGAVLVVQDEWLGALYPGEIVDLPTFFDRSMRLRNVLATHVRVLLSKGLSVVLDFPANTREQRAWFREILAQARVEHELHFIDAPDALCKRQLADRSKDLPAGTRWTTDAEFDAITAYFQPPCDEESFNIVRHERSC